MEFVPGDVRDLDIVAKACEGVDVVMHNVAQVPLPPGKGVPTPSGVEEVDEDVDDGVPAAVTGPQPNP